VGRGALMNFVDDVVVEVLSGLKDMDHLLALLNIYTAKGAGSVKASVVITEVIIV
jgi:hypothetical protein